MPPEQILEQFSFPSPVLSWQPFGNGHINNTVRVHCAEGAYIAQRLNRQVFSDGTAVMSNIARVLDHLSGKIPDPRRRLWLLPTRSGARWLTDPTGEIWRVYPLIPDTVTIEQVDAPAQAFAAAHGFARFLAQLADLPGGPLSSVIPGFHDTPTRLAQLVDAARADPCGRLAEVAQEVRWCLDQDELAGQLIRARDSGALAETATHNDTKINNLLLEPDGCTAACVIDLDTLMPGVVLYDFADLVRTGSCRAAEDADPAAMLPDPDLLAALVAGWLSGRGNAASAAERLLMPIAGAVITFEQGIRFLTDHLLGDRYYRIHHPGHNRDRARAQLALARALLARRADLARLIP